MQRCPDRHLENGRNAPHQSVTRIGNRRRVQFVVNATKIVVVENFDIAEYIRLPLQGECTVKKKHLLPLIPTRYQCCRQMCNQTQKSGGQYVISMAGKSNQSTHEHRATNVNINIIQLREQGSLS